MPTTIYDSSLVTQRHRDKTISGSFINRIQNPNNPTTSYAPRLGIYDQSIINTVKNGQMTTYRKNDGGCTRINIGCPCTTSSNSVIHNSITIPELGLGGSINPLQLPGSVTDIIVIYGSVIVKWKAPTVGVEEGIPFIYELTTEPETEKIKIGNGVTEYIYDTATDTPILVPGTAYNFIIRATNSLGAGEVTSTTDLFYAPFQAPTEYSITPYYNGITISFAFNSNLSNLSNYNTYELVIDSVTYISIIANINNEISFNELAIDTDYPAGYIVLKNPDENRISNRINIDSFKTLEKNSIKSVTTIDNNSESFGSPITYYIKIRFEMLTFPGTFNNAELYKNEDKLVSFTLPDSFNDSDYNVNTDIILNISSATPTDTYKDIDSNTIIEGCTLKVDLKYNDVNTLEFVSSEFRINKIDNDSFEII